ncbi:hypothetical protein [Acetobacter indonesiensis]|nr:hypothetical protein [Acetobacter indonesiensis]
MVQPEAERIEPLTTKTGSLMQKHPESRSKSSNYDHCKMLFQAG